MTKKTNYVENKSTFEKTIDFFSLIFHMFSNKNLIFLLRKG